MTGQGVAGDGWLQASLHCIEQNIPAALVTIVGFRGSCPRELGARMLVTPERSYGSVGGGTLEHMAMRKSRRLLNQESPIHTLLTLALEADVQQCCGGVVSLWIRLLGAADQDLWHRQEAGDDVALLTELTGDGVVRWLSAGDQRAALPEPVQHVLAEPRCGFELILDGEREFILERMHAVPFTIALFGAGHVGRALVRALAHMPCRVEWFDTRAQQFPAMIPENTRINVELQREGAVGLLPPGSFFLIMTHSHALDLDLCRAVLRRRDFAYLGLIGSASKRAQFERALLRDGLKTAELARLHCPIGLPEIKGKSPPVIAASVLAQLLIEHGRRPGREIAYKGIDPGQAEQSCILGVW